MSWYWLWMVVPAAVFGGILYSNLRPLTIPERAAVLAVETFERHFEKFKFAEFSLRHKPAGTYSLGGLSVVLSTDYEGGRNAKVEMEGALLPLWTSLHARLWARAQRVEDARNEAHLAETARKLAEAVISLERGL